MLSIWGKFSRRNLILAQHQQGTRTVHLAALSIVDVLKRTGGRGKLEDEYPVTPPNLLDACAARMEAYKHSHALAEESLTRARDQAAAGEAKWMSGAPASVLDGVPLAVKGNFLLKDVPMNTARTQLLRDHVPTHCASLVHKLSEAGCVFLGKTVVEEFGIGAVDMTVQPDAVLNPWYSTDEKSSEARFVGGRSGGSAVAVATGMAYAALSSDVLGGLRLTAAYSGIVGLKTSKGRLPRQGLLSVAGEWEAPGVLARTVSDAALLLAVLQGKDAGGCKKIKTLLDNTKNDPEKVQHALPALLGFPEGDRPLQGLRVGVVELSSSGIHPSDAQTEALKQGISYLEQAGAAVEEVQLPDPQQGVAAMYHLATAELLRSSSSSERKLEQLGFEQLGFEHANTSEEVYEEVRSILSATRARGLELSGHSDMSDEKAAHSAERFAESLKQVDILLLPSAPGVPPTVAEASEWGNEQLLSVDAINAIASLAGAPAMTVPVALASKEGLPLGVQVIGAPSQKAHVLAVGHVLERGAQSGFKAGSLLVPLHAPSEGKAPISTV